jgi:hypothetical protein
LGLCVCENRIMLWNYFVHKKLSVLYLYLYKHFSQWVLHAYANVRAIFPPPPPSRNYIYVRYQCIWCNKESVEDKPVLHLRFYVFMFATVIVGYFHISSVTVNIHTRNLHRRCVRLE